MDMFEQKAEARRQQEAPLAARMRPRNLAEFVGQEHLIGPGHVLRIVIETGQLPSVIFWGPPGSGKTTLAFIIANATQSHFSPLSAVSAGVADLRRIIEEARERRRLYQQKTILFIDEIHRFNKAQQDAILPYVEDGTVTMIGATTENPSFEVISALVSRSQVFVLKPLTGEDLKTIVRRALIDPERGLGKLNVALSEDALEHLIALSNNDARAALNVLEMAAQAAPADGAGKRSLTLILLEDALQHRALRYDKAGEEHYNLISALHKSMRGSDPDASLYWLGRMIDSGEDPLYIARRMVRFASEDVGLADPQALVITLAAQQAVHFIGLPEGNLALAEAAVYLATAPKSNALYLAYGKVEEDIRKSGSEPVPLHLRNAPTELMKKLGYSQGYKYAHKYEGHFVEQQNLPDSLVGHRYYMPGEQGYEKQVAERLGVWWGKKAPPAAADPRVVSFKRGEVTLQGIWHLPAGKGPFPAVVVCHPHPLYGGNMENSVVLALCEALAGSGMAALRFNFSSVGQGQSTLNGSEEKKDVQAALALAVRTIGVDPVRLGLAGYSFGASVALTVAFSDERVRALALISPPLSDAGWRELREFSRPRRLWVGDNDALLPVSRVQEQLKEASHDIYEVVPGADHFWWQQENELGGKVVAFLGTAFGIK
jgi:putative ATPase